MTKLGQGVEVRAHYPNEYNMQIFEWNYFLNRNERTEKSIFLALKVIKIINSQKVPKYRAISKAGVKGTAREFFKTSE